MGNRSREIFVKATHIEIYKKKTALSLKKQNKANKQKITHTHKFQEDDGN